MRQNLRSLEECLFNAFANSDWYDPQDMCQLWAIQEGRKRAFPENYLWTSHQARKQHDCERGCQIKSGDVYFRQSLGAAWGDDLKLCAGCLAMILYFQGVDRLPPYARTHWDEALKKPVRIEDASLED